MLPNATSSIDCLDLCRPAVYTSTQQPSGTRCLPASLLAGVILAGLGLVALARVGTRVVAHRLKLGLVQAAPEHLRLALAGVVHAGLHGACMRQQQRGQRAGASYSWRGCNCRHMDVDPSSALLMGAGRQVDIRMVSQVKGRPAVMLGCCCW